MANFEAVRWNFSSSTNSEIGRSAHVYILGFDWDRYLFVYFFVFFRLWEQVQIQPSHWKCQILHLENVCRQSRNCRRQCQRQSHLPYLSKGVPKVLKMSLETAEALQAPVPVPATLPRSWSRWRPPKPRAQIIILIIIKNTPGEVVLQHSVKRPPMLDEIADVQVLLFWFHGICLLIYYFPIF